jgi:hypothetical protein
MYSNVKRILLLSISDEIEEINGQEYLKAG